MGTGHGDHGIERGVFVLVALPHRTGAEHRAPLEVEGPEMGVIGIEFDDATRIDGDRSRVNPVAEDVDAVEAQRTTDVDLDPSGGPDGDLVIGGGQHQGSAIDADRTGDIGLGAGQGHGAGALFDQSPAIADNHPTGHGVIVARGVIKQHGRRRDRIGNEDRLGRAAVGEHHRVAGDEFLVALQPVQGSGIPSPARRTGPGARGGDHLADD